MEIYVASSSRLFAVAVSSSSFRCLLFWLHIIIAYWNLELETSLKPDPSQSYSPVAIGREFEQSVRATDHHVGRVGGGDQRA